MSQFLDTAGDMTKLVPDDSHVLDFFDVLETQFGGYMVDELHIVVKDEDFSDAQVRSTVNAMLDEMAQQELSALALET